MATIIFTAAACRLAQAIHRARAEAYDLVLEPWDTLPVLDRQVFVEEAALTLEAVKPIPPRTVADFTQFLMDTAVAGLPRRS